MLEDKMKIIDKQIEELKELWEDKVVRVENKR